MERVKPSFTLPMGDVPRSWSPMMTRDSQMSSLGFGVGFLRWVFFLFSTNGKSFDPYVMREKLGAGPEKGSQKRLNGYNGSNL